MANYEGTWWINGLAHQVGRLIAPNPAMRDAQSTIIGLGCVLFLAVSSTEPSLTVAVADQIGTPLQQIWPLPAGTVDWPFSRPMTDDEADLLAGEFSRMQGISPVSFSRLSRESRP